MRPREDSPRNSTELMPISTSSSDQSLRQGESVTEAEDAPCSSSWGSQQPLAPLEPSTATAEQRHTQQGWLHGLGSAAQAAAQRLHLGNAAEPAYQRLQTESDADNLHDVTEQTASCSPTAKLLQEQHAARQQASDAQLHNSSSSGVGSEEAVRFSVLQFIRFCGSG